jgi:speckle-type POZ protein
VGVVVSTADNSRPYSIEVPDSEIGYPFGTLLDTQEGVDVIICVAGEKFHAHKLVLASRSSFFRSELFVSHESDEEQNEDDTRNGIKEIVISDMDPIVFKVVYFYFCANLVPHFIVWQTLIRHFVFICANVHVLQAVLHFIYRDNLVNDDELSSSSSNCSIFNTSAGKSLPASSSDCFSIFNTLAGKLMAAANKYELPRLRLLCESYFCKHIVVNSVAATLALADRHHAMELKSVCLKFVTENLSGSKV